MSIFVGYKLLRQKGAFAAASGIITPAFLTIILIAKILEELINLKFIQSIFWGVGIGVVILILLAVKEMWNKSVVDKFTMTVFMTAFILSSLMFPLYL